MKKQIARWIFYNLSGDRDQYCTPPGSRGHLEFGGDDGDGKQMYVAMFGNDGFEIMLGTPHRWHVFYSAREARRLAWFILWHWWAKATWFGIRRRIWYWSLRTFAVSAR